MDVFIYPKRKQIFFVDKPIICLKFELVNNEIIIVWGCSGWITELNPRDQTIVFLPHSNIAQKPFGQILDV